MFTAAEKKYLAITLLFLAMGSGIKFYRHSQVHLGPFPDTTMLAADSIQASQAAQAGHGAEIDFMATENSLYDGASRKIGPLDSTTGALPVNVDVGKHPEYHAKLQFSGKVSLNHSGITELTQINGIGEKTAQGIIEFRKQNGPFQEIKDLCLVKGIGKKKLEKIIPFLIL